MPHISSTSPIVAGSSVTVTDGGTTLLVTTEDTYQPVFLGVLGIGPMPVSGTGQARLVRVVEGSER